MLGNHHAGAHDDLVAEVLEHEEVLALQRVLDAPGEAAHGGVDELLEHGLVVGQVDGVQHRSQPLEALQVRLLDIPDDEHGVEGL